MMGTLEQGSERDGTRDDDEEHEEEEEVEKLFFCSHKLIFNSLVPFCTFCVRGLGDETIPLGKNK